MDAFETAIQWVLKAEGAESNDPADPGGFTRYGISQRSHPNVDVKTLTESDAIEIYRKQYWQAYGLEKLPRPIAIAVFDGCVQHGPRSAIRMLQCALRVEIDGVIGMVTLAACYKADEEELLMSFLARRGVYYANLSHFARFGYGWFRRLFNLCTICQGA